MKLKELSFTSPIDSGELNSTYSTPAPGPTKTSVTVNATATVNDSTPRYGNDKTRFSFNHQPNTNYAKSNPTPPYGNSPRYGTKQINATNTAREVNLKSTTFSIDELKDMLKRFEVSY